MATVFENNTENIFVPRTCDATSRLISAKDHASIQLNIVEVNEDGTKKNSNVVFTLCGFVRKHSNADDSVNRLATEKGLLKNVWSYQK